MTKTRRSGQKTGSVNYEYFIKTDTSAYRGEWVAISGQRIVAHGKDAQTVYKEAKRKSKAKSVSLAKVPDQELLVLRFC